MLDIPINTALYNESKKMIHNTGFFVTNDVYLKYSCFNELNCFENFTNYIRNAELIIINEKEIDHYVQPLSQKIRNNLRKELFYSKTHKLVMKKYFSHYGNLLFYVANDDL